MKTIDVEILKQEEGGNIAVLYLDNAETRNSLTLELGLQFHHEITRLSTDESEIRALVISGRNGVFSSGGDFGLLASFAERDPDENRSFMGSFYRLFLSVRSAPFPVIAAVNGHAVGASLALALACDIRYFVPDAKYAFNFVRIGIHPGMGSSFLVKEVAGLHQAQELLLSGRYFSGEEALRRGLCHDVFPAAQVMERALETAREIAAAAPQAVRLLKKGLYLNHSLEEALDYEAAAQAENYQSEDFREALRSIGEKRSPRFRGV
ncbi:MAG: enoyl-CoA hydratase/isomerase family protein [Leptospirales bacterium]|nr:enoyl-CoA hydratase/isomerase family protein [Leptospirales bacterium]